MNMPTKNIFAGFGARSEFVNLIYAELMKRDFVSYADILTSYYGRPKGNHEKIACNSETGSYGEVTQTIEPYRELRGKILMYSENLEVMQPESLREQIKNIIKQQMEIYSNEI